MVPPMGGRKADGGAKEETREHGSNRKAVGGGKRTESVGKGRLIGELHSKHLPEIHRIEVVHSEPVQAKSLDQRRFPPSR